MPRLPAPRPARLVRQSLVDAGACRPGLVSQRPPLLSCLVSSASSSAASLHTSAVRQATPLGLPTGYTPPTQPASAKRPDIRKTQLLRSYTSLLRSTPLMLVFQHSNLTGPEWTAVRRELTLALGRVHAQQQQLGIDWPAELPAHIRMQVVRTRIFDVALRLTEFFDPAAIDATSPTATHDLSETAAAAIRQAAADGATAADRSVYGQLAPLLVGPLAVLTFPTVSPAHLAAALSVLCPSPPAFPPPTRRASPGYHEPIVQGALPKLLLVGGRVEGKALDGDALRWVGSIAGGRAGLQAQLVALLQSAGLGLTTALEGASKSLWLTMESRRSVLEEEAKPAEAADAKPEEVKAE